MELYIHDISDVFPDVEVGSDGHFGYPTLPLYFSEPENRWAFLIASGRHIAGFALVTRGSPATDDPEVLDVAEFFVLRRFRRGGVGRRAASLLWQTIPGKWTVRVSERNVGAVGFWSRVVDEFTALTAAESTMLRGGTTWRVFSFESRPPTQAG